MVAEDVAEMRLTALVLFAVSAGAPSRPSPNQAVSVPAAKILSQIRVGEMSAFTGGKPLVAPSSPEDAEAVRRAADAGDEPGIRALIAGGRAARFTPGVAVLVLERYEDLFRRTAGQAGASYAAGNSLELALNNVGYSSIEEMARFTLLVKVRILTGPNAGRIGWLGANRLKLPTRPRTP